MIRVINVIRLFLRCSQLKQTSLIKKKTLIWIIVIWILITLINYYYTNFFILAFIWLGMSLIFGIVTIIQIIKLISERKNLTKFRILKVIVFALLFVLTFQRNIPNGIIEKTDWVILKNKRTEIVEQIKRNEIKGKGTSGNGIFELPFEFPILSNAGNDVWVFKNKENNSVTIQFWVFRNFFDSPSTLFVYSDDKERIADLEQKVKENPKNNWKLDKNWYRIYGGF